VPPVNATLVSGWEARIRRRSLALDPATGTAAVLLAALCCLWIWWGWKQGAFFEVVFYPGAIGGFAVIALLLVRAPLTARLQGPSAVALGALAAIAIWTAFSVLWSSAKAVAVADAERALFYLAAFLIGFWTCNLLGRRMGLAMLPLAIAGAVVGVATTLVLLTGDDFRTYLHGDSTLRYPLGYRNADAAFFLLGFWALLTLAGGAGRWPARTAAIAAATMLFDLAILAQSRGSVVAMGVAAVVYLAFAPRRLDALLVLALAIAPALLAAPRLLDVYQHGAADPAVLPLLRTAARWTFASTAVSLLLAALVLLPIEKRLRAVEPQALRRLNRAVAVVCAVLALGGATVFVAAKGGPVAFLNQRLLEVRKGGEPSLQGQGARFGVNLGSNRGDFWRVSIDDAQRDPLLGDGAGGFRFSYLQRRDSPITPEDPHSVEMLMLSELGLPGLAFLFTFLTAVTLACLRSRRLGPSAAALVAGALTCGSYWLAHASLDWFWSYPALTAPVIGLLGAAVAPSTLALESPPRQRWRLGLAAVMAAAAIIAVPLFLADRYRDRAVGEWRTDSSRAFDDLDLAADLNPFDEEPLLVKGAIALRVGRPDLALDAFEAARSRTPDNYASYFFIARTLQGTDPAQARRELTQAQDLNPDGPELKQLDRELQIAAEAGKTSSASNR
jgi:hypothetical protein